MTKIYTKRDSTDCTVKRAKRMSTTTNKTREVWCTQTSSQFRT